MSTCGSQGRRARKSRRSAYPRTQRRIFVSWPWVPAAGIRPRRSWGHPRLLRCARAVAPTRHSGRFKRCAVAAARGRLGHMSTRAGLPAEASDLVDIDELINAYYDRKPDAAIAEQRVAFGT